MNEIKALRNKKKRINRIRKEAFSLNYVDDQDSLEDVNNTNIEVFGYKTKNFDICPKAVDALEILVEEEFESESTRDIVIELAESIDELFEIEKEASNNELSKSDIDDALDAFYESSYRVGQLENEIKEVIMDDFEFLIDHLKTILKK